MKCCTLCKENKDVSEFYKHPTTKDGLAHRCKVCVRVKASEYQKKWIQDAKNKNYVRTKSQLKKRPYLKFREDKCRRCGFMPEKDCQLTVAHIDKNRNNNSKENLQTLCHNCHNLKSWYEVVEPEKLIFLNLIPSTS